MMRQLNLLFGLGLLFSLHACAQTLPTLGQPMLGNVTYNEASVFVPHAANVKNVQLAYKVEGARDWQFAQGVPQAVSTLGIAPTGHFFTLNDLSVASAYVYQAQYDTFRSVIDTFKTPGIWQYRTDAPDFSFLFGSCFYINDTPFDRPGKPYGGNTDILRTMAKHEADFTLWGGDNLYYRESDVTSVSGMMYRYNQAFSHPDMAALRSARMNLAIWDDHDYGDNDSDRSFSKKAEALTIFRSFWNNPYYGEANNPGAYCTYEKSDCAFFLLDNRTFRAPNRLKDTIDGKPNTDKTYFGQQQLTWLIDGLLNSSATFKFVVCGNQIINPVSNYESMINFPYEYQQLMDAISTYKINGVIFLSGDRHHTELLQATPAGGYPLYDFTCSAVTSGTHKLKESDIEFSNPYRLAGTLFEDNNYAELKVSGTKNERVLSIRVLDRNGKEQWTKKIAASELKWPKKN